MNDCLKILTSIWKATFSGNFYKINFAVTSACNSRCQTCQVWRLHQQNPKNFKKDLSLKEIRQFFSQLPEEFVWLSLSGGEPFLRKDLGEICKAATKSMPNLGLISIPSNGLLTKPILETTKKILKTSLKNLFLNFSLDGPEAIHDQIRGIKGAYQKTWTTYTKVLQLVRKEPRLHVNLETTISRLNILYLKDFFEKLLSDGHKITLTLAHTGYLYKNQRGNNDFVNIDQDSKKLKQIIEMVQKKLTPWSFVEAIERIYLRKIMNFYENRRKQPIACTALKTSIALDSQGNLLPCFMWGKKLANIRQGDYDLKKILKKNQRQFKRARKMIVRQLCPNCWTPCEAYQAIISNLLKLNFFTLV